MGCSSKREPALCHLLGPNVITEVQFTKQSHDIGHVSGK